MEEFRAVDKAQLKRRLIGALPDIRGRLSLTDGDIEAMTGIGAERLAAIEAGQQEMRWSEYLSIVFVLWSNDACKGLLDEKGLFPPELRRAFSVDRKRHGLEET